MSDKNPKNKLVNSPEWQKVRQSLLGRWNMDPGGCCEVLKKYLGNISSTSNDKIKVVMNYLTGSGFRMGKIKHPCIQQLRTNMSSEIKIRKAQKRW